MQREEIQLRQMTGQHLIQKADTETVVHDLCGIQAQFLSNAMHALAIRCTRADMQSLVKSWTLRGTMHLFLQQDLPLMLHRDRTSFLRACDTLQADEHITKERKQFFARLIVDAVAAGTDEREGLKELCFSNGMTQQESESVFNAWGGMIRALCEEGHICHKVQQKKAFQLCPLFEPMSADEAQTELARRYFTHYAPATIRDAAYFFGTAQSQVKRWLDRLPVSSCTCENRTYYFIPSEEKTASDIPACIFLAGFDPLMLGYEKKESLYLAQDHLRGIFNLAGIVMPAVLLYGRVCGRWKKTGAKLQVTLFETVSQKQLIEDAARQLWPDLKTVVF